MLVYNSKRYIPTDMNVMVIEDNSGKYYYIHRMLYNYAVILDYKYNSEIDELAQLIAGPGGNADRYDVTIFHEKVPHPINILAPYLLLCNTPFDNLEDMIGAIHVMSNCIDFVRYVTVAYQDRVTQMSFSMSIKNEYKLGWDNFIQTCIPYDDNLFLQKQMPMMGTAGNQTMSVVQPMYQQPQPVYQQPVAPTPTPAPAPAPVVEPEPEPVPVASTDSHEAPPGYFWVEGLPDGIFIPEGTIEFDDTYKWSENGILHTLYKGEYSEKEEFDPLALLDNLKFNVEKTEQGMEVSMTETGDSDTDSVKVQKDDDTDDDDDDDSALDTEEGVEEVINELSTNKGLEGLSALAGVL